ncbi:MAG: hypothetical protein R6U19_09670 [Bacteroidales bacterium]
MPIQYPLYKPQTQKMSKRIHYITQSMLSLIILLWACQNKEQEGQSSIDAEFTHSSSNKVYLHDLQPDKWQAVDSAYIDEQGKVSFQFTPGKTGFYTISTDRDNLAILQVYPDTSQSISADIRQIPQSYETQGSKGSKLLESFKKTSLKHRNTIDSLLWEKTNYSGDNIEQQQAETDSLIEVIRQKQKQYQLKLVRNNKDVLAVLIPLFQPFGRKPLFTIEDHPGLFDSVHTALKKQYPQNPHVLDLYERITKYNAQQRETEEREKKLQVSNEAPPFSLKNIHGKQVNLPDLQGNYVLLDFWWEHAANYRENRRQIAQETQTQPNLIYFSVYQGNDKLIWKELAEKYPENSVHARAEKVVQNMYNAKDKERLFLISPEGKILAKDFDPDELTRIIQENETKE